MANGSEGLLCRIYGIYQPNNRSSGTSPNNTIRHHVFWSNQYAAFNLILHHLFFLLQVVEY